MTEKYYIRYQARVRGPYTPEELKSLAKRGKFRRHYDVSQDKLVWTRASEHPELFPSSVPKKRRARPQPTDAESEEAASDSETYSLQSAETPAGDSEGDGAKPAGADDALVEALPDDGWYFADGDQPVGPVDFSQLQAMAASGQLQADSLVWCDGLDDWTDAQDIPDLIPEAAADFQPMERVEPHAAGPSSKHEVPPMAIASLVLGLCGASVLPFLGSILAIVFGHTALKQMQAEGSASGRGFALAGLILGYGVLGLTVITSLIVMIVLIVSAL